MSKYTKGPWYLTRIDSEDFQGWQIDSEAMAFLAWGYRVVKGE